MDAVTAARATSRDLADDGLASVITGLTLSRGKAVQAAAAGERGGGATLTLNGGRGGGRRTYACQLLLTYSPHTTRSPRLLGLGGGDGGGAPAAMAPGLTGTTTEEEAGAVSMLIAYEKL